MTAYARECERAGVRIPRWRDATGCKNVIPFKYSGEHFGSSEQSHSTHINASANEVINLNHGADDGGEVLDDLEDVLDLGGIGEVQPAYRAPLSSRKPRQQDSEKKRKRKQRRKRKREKERKRKEKERRRVELGRGRTRELLGSMNGMTLKRVSVGGEKKKLRWQGTKDTFRPPFELVLRSEDEEGRTDDQVYDDAGPGDKAEESSFELNLHNIDYSELPNSKGRTPIPLISGHSAQTIHRKNWKRRRSIISPNL